MDDRTKAAFASFEARLCAALAGHTAYPIPTVAPAVGEPEGGDCRAVLVAEEDVRRALGEDDAMVAEGEPEGAIEFAAQLWDMAAVFAGTLALLAGAATWVWLLGGLGR